MKQITLHQISHAYDTEKVLDSVSLSITTGEFFTLLGPSGCGKTTILRILAGFIRPTEGSVLLDDTEITGWKPERRNMGVVFQNYALFPNMTVEENIAYGLKIRKLDKPAIAEKCGYYMELAGLSPLRGRRIDELSGGQQQRVAIARALVIEPRMLLLDEPMSNLDIALRVKMREELRAIQKETGVTTLFITHDQQEALSISDRIAVMDKGRIYSTGTPREVYNDLSNDFTVNFIGASNRIEKVDYGSFGIAGARGEAPCAYVRPEQLRLRRGGTGLPVRVENVKFAGMYYEYTVRQGLRTYTVVELNRGSAGGEWKIGDTARLCVANGTQDLTAGDGAE